jgi:3-phenylpropionate/trans-cinnamate dioxygenase ferredoxin reductase component
MPPPTVLIVGAGLAGSRCAESLRARGFPGRVVVAGDEPVPPYERPALSKAFLDGRRDEGSLQLRAPSFWRERDVDLRCGVRIDAVDSASRLAFTATGEEVAWDVLVLATGSRARRLEAAPAGVTALRTLSDARSLRAALRPGARLVVVGAGFVGTEVASTALALGADVTLVDAAAAPLERVLGREVGAVLASRYREAGVRLLLDVGLESFDTENGSVSAVRLTDGGAVAADAVLVAIGAEPETSIRGLHGMERGIPTDPVGRSALANVFACGDVAVVQRADGRRVRLEHWTDAARQGSAVAAAIVGEAPPRAEAPYFWSDQFGLRLQYVGDNSEAVRVELDGDGGSFRAWYRDADGRLVAALLANRPREAAALRRELASALPALVA